MNNTAEAGGVIYGYYYSYTYGQNHIYTENSADHIQSEFSGEEERRQSLFIYNSYFVDNKAGGEEELFILTDHSLICL